MNSGDKALACHLAELNTADAECADITLGSSCYRATVVQPDRTGIFRKFSQTGIIPSLFKLSAFLGILGT